MAELKPAESGGGAGFRDASLARGTARFDRLIWLLLFLGAGFVLVAARWLVPSPSGVGTHEQLGLPPCGFLAWLSLPCPACGLTTSFAHLARLELNRAIQAHPLGLPLFLFTAGLLPLACTGLLRGWSVAGAIVRCELDRWCLWFTLAALAVWLVRLLMLVA